MMVSQQHQSAGIFCKCVISTGTLCNFFILLNHFRVETVTSYGVRKSRQNSDAFEDNIENENEPPNKVCMHAC